MARVYLVEAKPWSPATGLPTTVRLAGGGERGYTHRGTNDWIAGVLAAPRFSTLIGFDAQGFTGGALPTTGAITFVPSDSGKLWSVADRDWPGAPVTIWTGDDRAAVPTWTVELVGTVAGISTSSGALTITISDLSGDLTTPVITAKYLGTGGVEGEAEAKDRLKRRSWGACFNVEALLLDKANHIYEVGDAAFPMQAFDVVKLKGRPIENLIEVAWAGSIAATHAALVAAEEPEGGGAIAPSIARLKWWSDPAGTLTVDLRGEIGTGYVETVASIAERIVAARSAMTVANVAAINAVRPGQAGLHIDSGSESAASALDRLLPRSSLVWVLEPTGQIRIEPVSLADPVETVVVRSLSREAAYKPAASVVVGYQRNHRPLSAGELSAIFSASDIVLEDGSSIEDLNSTVRDASNPNVLTPGKKVELRALDRRVQARYDELATQFVALTAYSPEMIAAYQAMYEAMVARDAFFLTFDPPLDDELANTPVVRDQLEEIYATIAVTTEAFEKLLTVGVPIGGMVGGVPVRQVTDVVDIVIAQQKTDAELVSNGSLSPAEKTAIYDQVVFLYGGFLQGLIGLGQKLNIDGEPAQDAYEDLVGYLIELENWESTTLSSPVSAATYLALRGAFFAARDALDAEIKRVQGGAQSADPIYAVSGGALLSGNRIKGQGTWYSLDGYAGGAHLKMLAVAGDVAWGLVEDPAADGIEDIAWGWKLVGGTLSALKNGTVIQALASGLTPPVQASVDYFDAGAAGEPAYVSLPETVPGVGLGYQTAVAGKTYYAKAFLLTANAEMLFSFFVGDRVAPYTSIPGMKPPVDATPGSNLVIPERTVLVGATGPDAAGYFTLDSNDQIYFIGTDSRKVRYTDEPFLKITVEFKDDTGLGSAEFLLVCDTASSGVVSQAVNIRAATANTAFSPDPSTVREGGGTLRFPIDTLAYSLYAKTAFTSGSIKIKRPVVTITQDGGTVAPGASNNDGVRADGYGEGTVFRTDPNRNYLGGLRPDNAGGPDPDSGVLHFRQQDRALLLTPGQLLDPDGFFRTFGTAFLFAYRSQATGTATGSLTLKISVRAASTNVVTVLRTYDLRAAGGEEIIEIEPGSSYIKIEIEANLSSGFLALSMPTMTLRNHRATDNQAVLDQINPVITNPSVVPNLFFNEQFRIATSDRSRPKGVMTYETTLPGGTDASHPNEGMGFIADDAGLRVDRVPAGRFRRLVFPAIPAGQGELFSMQFKAYADNIEPGTGSYGISAYINEYDGDLTIDQQFIVREDNAVLTPDSVTATRSSFIAGWEATGPELFANFVPQGTEALRFFSIELQLDSYGTLYMPAARFTKSPYGRNTYDLRDRDIDPPPSAFRYNVVLNAPSVFSNLRETAAVGLPADEDQVIVTTYGTSVLGAIGPGSVRQFAVVAGVNYRRLSVDESTWGPWIVPPIDKFDGAKEIIEPKPNVVANGGLRFGASDWLLGTGWTGPFNDQPAPYFKASVTNAVAYSRPFAAMPDQPLTLAADFSTSAAFVRAFVEWLDAFGELILTGTSAPGLLNGELPQRRYATNIAPTDAAFARIGVISGDSGAGQFSTIARIKAEWSATSSPFSDEASTGAAYAPYLTDPAPLTIRTNALGEPLPNELPAQRQVRVYVGGEDVTELCYFALTTDASITASLDPIVKGSVNFTDFAGVAVASYTVTVTYMGRDFVKVGQAVRQFVIDRQNSVSSDSQTFYSGPTDATLAAGFVRDLTVNASADGKASAQMSFSFLPAKLYDPDHPGDDRYTSQKGVGVEGAIYYSLDNAATWTMISTVQPPAIEGQNYNSLGGKEFTQQGSLAFLRQLTGLTPNASVKFQLRLRQANGPAYRNGSITPGEGVFQAMAS